MRYRPSAGRLIVELFYGSDHMERVNGLIILDIRGMARKLHVRPVRLCESLEWMERYGLLTNLMVGRKEARMYLREPEWKKRKVWDGKEA